MSGEPSARQAASTKASIEQALIKLTGGADDLAPRTNGKPKEPSMQIRSAVESTILLVAGENDRKLPPLSDDLPLVDSGLDSLCLAVIVARLEDELGIDPFRMAEDAAFPTTIGEFVQLYENAAALA